MWDSARSSDSPIVHGRRSGIVCSAMSPVRVPARVGYPRRRLAGRNQHSGSRSSDEAPQPTARPMRWVDISGRSDVTVVAIVEGIGVTPRTS